LIFFKPAPKLAWSEPRIVCDLHKDRATCSAPGVKFQRGYLMKSSVLFAERQKRILEKEVSIIIEEDTQVT
jgi:hypothetical protein